MCVAMCLETFLRLESPIISLLQEWADGELGWIAGRADRELGWIEGCCGCDPCQE